MRKILEEPVINILLQLCVWIVFWGTLKPYKLAIEDDLIIICCLIADLALGTIYRSRQNRDEE